MFRGCAHGGTADGAGGLLLEPGVDAGDVEGVTAVGEHAHHIFRLVFLQAHRAAACGRAPSLADHFVKAGAICGGDESGFWISKDWLVQELSELSEHVPGGKSA